MQYLRESTASQEISLGQFLDSTDGNTEENGLTIANTDIKLRKHGTTTLANKNSGGATSISNGVYHATLDATDSNTLGMLEVYVHVAGALAVKNTYSVIPAAVFDAMFVDQLTGPYPKLGISEAGTAQAATSTTLQLRSASTFANDEVIGSTIVILTATAGAGQSRIITDYVSSTDTATVDTWTTTPTGTITYMVIPTPPSSATSPVEANITQLSGSTTSASNLAASTLGIVAGAAIAGTLSDTQMTTDLTEATNDHYIDGLIVWTSGVLAGSRATISDYVGSTKLLTYSATPSGESPSATDTFVIV